jgi:SH3-like domain-containing protein
MYPLSSCDRKHRRSLEPCVVLFALALATLILCCGSAAAQADEPGEAAVTVQAGEVTADNVYVRRGPSSNHYPILKLNAGTRVTIVSEQPEWYEILPPEGALALISVDYVDTADEQSGVVNGDNVRVRAISNLPEYAKRREPQMKLSRGARVRIVGRIAAGFYKIEPPSGYTLWISQDYVNVLPGQPTAPVRRPTPAEIRQAEDSLRQPAVLPDQPATPAGGARPATSPEADDGSPASGTAKPDVQKPPTEIPTSPYRDRLLELDVQAQAELEKPAAERAFAALIEEYRKITMQGEDDFALRYAKKRIDQLEYLAGLTAAIQDLRKLASDTQDRRRQLMEERARLPQRRIPLATGFDAKGELRVSALYPPGSKPRRYRLVDSADSNDRTLGYVEIPEDSSINVQEFLGRYVGVRAPQKMRLRGSADTVPIYIATELVILQPEQAAGSSERPD